jgi:hypothetical protein
VPEKAVDIAQPPPSRAAADSQTPALPQLARAPLAALAVAVAVVLIVFSNRYGYHGDELYFLVAAHHLALGYPDLPPLVPLLARLLTDVAPGSLVLLRLPSALAAAAIVVLTALTCRELGGSRVAQLVAAAAMAVSPLLLAAAHLFGTTPFDLFFWTLLVFLVVRILRSGEERLWLVVGVVAGIGLLNKDLVAFLAFGVLVGLAIAGPRRMLGSPWLWAGALIAGLLWTPYLVWQAQHGWPQLAVAHSIAAGRSGTSEPRWAFLPYQLVLIGPYLAWVWIVGLVRLFRDPTLRFARVFAWSWVVLAAVFIVAGGKPYYLGGLLPLLLAAGAPATIDWLSRSRARLRRGGLIAGIALTALTAIVVTLPVIPVRDLHSTNIGALNNDALQTVGWPAYVGEIATVYHALPPGERASAAAAHKQLRRGRRDRPLRLRSGAARGLQRPRRLLVLGSAAGQRHDLRRGGLRTRLPHEGLRQRAPRQASEQPPRREQRQPGGAGLGLPAATRRLECAVAQVPVPGVTPLPGEHQPRDERRRLFLHRRDGVRIGVQGDRGGLALSAALKEGQLSG